MKISVGTEKHLSFIYMLLILSQVTNCYPLQTQRNILGQRGCGLDTIIMNEITNNYQIRLTQNIPHLFFDCLIILKFQHKNLVSYNIFI